MDLHSDSAYETAKRRSLQRHRTIATGCLVLAGLIYLATQFVPEPGFGWLLLRAGAEAGLIGGLADWFAVTALFRRPFGLPIPHTAIIPRNKDRIGEGLGRFVERNFLAPELIRRRLHESNAAARLGGWLREPDNAGMLADQLTAIAPDVVRSLDDTEVRAFYHSAFSRQLGGLDVVPFIGRLLRLLTESRQHQQLFDRLLRLGRVTLRRNQGLIYAKVETRSSWWMPKTVDERLAKAIIAGVEDLLGDLADQEHPARQDFDRAARELAQKLERSPEFRARVDQLKRQVLASPEMQSALGQLWDELRGRLLAALEDPAAPFRGTLAASLQSLGATLEGDAAAQERLNRRLESVIGGFVVPFRAEIGRFIADVVASWDAGTVTERLELAVGTDLQYIRINGTLVGALAGCVLFLLSHYVF